MTELRTLMQEAVASPPDDHLDVSAVLRRGGRVRRRRAAALTGTAVAAVIVGAMVLGNPGRPTGTGPDPAGAGAQVTLDAAAPARAGEDYDVVAELGDVPERGDALFAGTTEDGQVLLWEETEGPEGLDVRLGLFDPQSTRTTWLPQDDVVVTEPVELSAQRLTFLTEVTRMGPRVASFDRASGTWSVSTWEDLRGSFRAAALGPDDRLWFDGGGGQARQLVSGALEDPTDLREEGIAVSAFDVEGDRLVHLGAGSESDTLVVRDLGTGERRSYPGVVPQGRCGEPDLDLGGDLVALSWNCGYSGNLADPQPSDNAVLVLSTDGTVVADVAGLPGNIRLDAHVLGDDVLLTSPTPRTTYDPDVCDFPFDGMPDRYLDAWSRRADALARESDAADGWEYCQVSHQAYRELVLPHLDEARVPRQGYGDYLVDGETGELRRLDGDTPSRVVPLLAGDDRVVTATRVVEVR